MKDRIDSELSEFIGRVRDKELANVPGFEEILSRKPRSSESLSLPRIFVTIFCFAVMVTVVVFGVASLLNNEQKPVAMDKLSGSGDGAKCNVDFEHFETVVDTYFERERAFTWRTPSDSLLALNIQLPEKGIKHE